MNLHVMRPLEHKVCAAQFIGCTPRVFYFIKQQKFIEYSVIKYFMFIYQTN